MLNALLISNNVAGLENYYVSSELVHYTICRISADFNPDLTPYDVLVVPNGSDHVAMLTISDTVRAFLDAGKAVVCSDGWFTNWVPGNQWVMDNTKKTMDVRYTIGTDRYGLFDGLAVDDLTFSHGMSGWWACGYIKAANGADVVLADTWQRPIIVLDEVSTNGRLLLTASGPLADMTYDGSQTSPLIEIYRRFLEKVVSRAISLQAPGSRSPVTGGTASETPDADASIELANRPSHQNQATPTIGLIFNGVWSHYAMATAPKYRDFYKLIYIYDLDEAAVAGLDALVIPFQSNQGALTEKKSVIYNALAQGKKVFVEGDSSTDWLDARWEDRPVNNYWWVDTPDKPPISQTDYTHPMYQGLTPRQACWHTHGVYTQVPDHADIVQTNPEGDVISWQTHHYGGTLFATTLDPIVEHGVQQITHLDNYVDRLTEWLSGNKPSPERMTIDPTLYGAGFNL